MLHSSYNIAFLPSGKRFFLLICYQTYTIRHKMMISTTFINVTSQECALFLIYGYISNLCVKFPKKNQMADIKF
jgi:hypothetical protein